ncbi:hypothetical protein KC343_g8626 [Hortaea werneckii]|uniref:Ketoreductase (KR) domain-containing protein n=1 Tax=Hortaea werneckii TaxID=91943 RepID=A0A3M7ESI9_HORWE|nr:hypothetical protein KC352_g17127 [Hortaea werneckii]KAI7560885.1 hypothetical protein KC317_g9440 [Hortaea werneckii]KAI7619686.1 hypothetical protein KC343_g8626 [Hortaea werneckii]KAI7622106.1 hypothetical protein KC346_g3364 [Hortaea werneckii]KAI7678254.1 hypothetical protein KC319_g3456 [Hortaea werneckii]
MAFTNRLAILAGGFGGLATETGKLLRQQGSKLALLYAPFEASKREQTLKEHYGSSTSDDVAAYECDITSEKSVRQAFLSLREQMLETASPAFPSILVNAAGYCQTAPFEDTPPEVTQKSLEVNILGPMLVSQAFAKMYWNQAARLSKPAAESKPHGAVASGPPPGRIISISSQAAHVALPDHGAYCASKAGLHGLTNCMAAEWGKRGITANTVSPTVSMTPLGKKAWADEKQRKDMFDQIPAGRFAEPHEIAEAIVFLCQDSSGMINGADIRIDGGFTIQ